MPDKIELVEEEIVASIVYSIKNTGECIVDIDLEEINENFQLKNMPNTYLIGEMLDWDAPTGGYLLQACMSMGHYLAKQL